MKITFRLRYHTRFGESLWLAGLPSPPGGSAEEKTLPLEWLDAESWQASVDWPGAAVAEPLRYDYLLRNADGSTVRDWGLDRRLAPGEFAAEHLLVIDSWNAAGDPANAFDTEPFRRVLLAPNSTEVTAPAPANPTHTFRVKAPLLARGQTLCLLGEGPALGGWTTTAPVLLNRARETNELGVQLDLRRQPFPFAYKYGVFDLEKKAFIRYEEGPNRVLNDSIAPGRHTLVNDGFVRLPADTWKGAGVAIPVFSLRSQNSFGTGEFLDLKPLADWAAAAGLKLIQILPVNDTTATHTRADSYPYAAISAFALHPLYLNLAAVAGTAERALLAALEPERRRLNALETVDYEAVMKAKLGFLKQIFPARKEATFRSREYKAFLTENRDWLLPYAAFCHLRDRFGTADFDRWPEHSRFDAARIGALAEGNDEIAFHCFLQFHLHRQLQEATAHARARGIIVKGDIAIGVARRGADVWREPELFHPDLQAGAPPDPFAAKGQNWGFPTYNWLRMESDGFAWWKRRFAQMSRYFDAFRIDHILGFFRIWSIPIHAVEGILGFFSPAVAVETEEFARRGIVFDRERFTRPFINDAVLKEIFGGERDFVRREFLEAAGGGAYCLKPAFATQRQVEDYFEGFEPGPRNARLRAGLFDLISNVILLEAGGGGGSRFHFRFGMEHTSSFRHLPGETRHRLRELYVDYFFRRQDAGWRREAMLKLPALKRVTRMLICGEDLGLVPACVPGVMKELGLLSLEIQRMPKKIGQAFSRPADAPYLSVVTPSTHDMSTIRGWWEEDRAAAQKLFNHELGLAGKAPGEAAPQIVRAVVDQHLASPAMWSIFQLQDLLGMSGSLRRPEVHAERINCPDNSRHYWRYRMHLGLEQLQQEHSFTAELRERVQRSGR